MQQGPTEKKIIEMSVRQGVPLPQRIQNAPSLLPGLDLYYIAFMDLMASRQTGMGLGPIWWDTIQRYCDHYEITGAQCEDMHFHVKNLDQVYLKYNSKKE